ncbi:Peptidase M50, partial [Crocosphaera watsonii WH 0003]
MLQNEAAQRIQEEEAKKDENKTPSLTTEFNDSSDNKNISDLIPIPDEDLQLIKGIFSIDTFFATETISYQEGAIFRGNLRGETEESYQKLSEKLKDSFGEKYRLFLVEGSEGKPVVIILPSSDDPQPTTLVQKNLALVLLVGTVFTTLEAASILLGFDLFNNWGRYIETLPIGLALWGIFIFHEVGHRVAAKRYDIKMSVPFFLPTWQIGSFGAITRFESLIPTRNALFDVALAGPACGGILSFILLIIGLVLSHDGSLFQVPTQFFQGSILVGSLAKVVLGEQLQNAIVDVHPLTVVGWLGLVVTALNLMPAGQLDGGRIIQAIYGRKTARRATIITLVILGIVTIFSPANP